MPRLGRLAAPLALTLLAAFLLLWRLDTPLLWQDEAETANLAANVLAFGYPTPWDGHHLVTQEVGRDSVRLGGHLVWAWHPWLQHYLAAAGLALFGHDTAGARLPFALLALLSVPLVFAWRRRRDAPSTAVVTTLIYSLSIAFVLYSRQCRYYSLLFLGGLWATAAYERRWSAAGTEPGSRRPGLSPGASLALGLTLVFYANPLTGLVLAAGFLVHGVLFDRRRGLPLAPLVGSLALLSALAAPWLALVAASQVRPPSLGPAGRGFLLLTQIWRFQYTLLPAVLWPALAWLGWRARRQGAAGAPRVRELELLAVLTAALLVGVSLEAPLGTARYLLPVWPLAAAALGGLWEGLHRRSVLAGGAFLAVLLLTDLLPALPALPIALARPGHTYPDREAGVLDKLAYQGRPDSPLLRFLLQQERRETGPVSAIVRVARGLRQPPRLVVASYAWESLHFYLGVPVVGPGGQRFARRRLGLPQVDLARADLVVPRRGWPRPVLHPEDDAGFALVVPGAPDDAYENLPDPTDHRFAPSHLPPLKIWVRRALLPAADLTDGAG